MKRVFIFHGWGAKPSLGWYPKLKEQLEKEGYEVHAPQMPGEMDPKPAEWIAEMNRLIGKPDQETYLVGHSLGPTAILLYLEQLKAGEQIGGVLSVAGGFHYQPENEPEDLSQDPWYGRLPDFKKIKAHCANIVALFSDDDPIIVLSDKDIFAQELGAQVIVEHKQGHFLYPAQVKNVVDAFHQLKKNERPLTG